MHGSLENFTVGDPYEIKCEAYTDLVIHSDLVSFTWIGPNNETIMANNRTNVTTATSVGNNHTSTLQFVYLTEEDQGLYTCHVAILNNTDSESFELGVLSEFLSTTYWCLQGCSTKFAWALIIYSIQIDSVKTHTHTHI